LITVHGYKDVPKSGMNGFIEFFQRELQTMNWQTFGSRDQKPSRQNQRAIRLLLEALEDRQVPALLMDMGSESLTDDPDLMKFPGMKTPYSSDKLIVSVTGANGFENFLNQVKNSSNRDLQKAIDPTQTKIFWEKPDGSTMIKVALNEDVDPVGAVVGLKLLPDVQYASLNFVYRPQEGYGRTDYLPNDPFAGPALSQQYHHGLIESYKAWESVRGTSPAFTRPDGSVRGPIIAVPDDGFDINHPELRNVMWVNAKETPGNGIDDDNNGYVDDINGVNIAVPRPGMASEPDGFIQPSNSFDDHGTHVIGIIAAQMDNNTFVSGVAGGGIIRPDGTTAPTGGARIMGIKNSYTQITNGALTNISFYDSFVVVEGLKYAMQNGADIVSTSQVIISGQAPFQFPFLSDDQATFDAYKVLHDAGIVCLVASANDDVDNTTALEKLPYVIWVSSTDDRDVKSGFSNYGKTVDVTAPGSNILSTAPNNFFQFLSGTSMATPVAAGVVALIKAAHPNWTRDQIVSQLYATANNIDNLNPTYRGELGFGRVNAFGGVTSSSGFSSMSIGQSIMVGGDLDGTVKVWTPTGRLQQNIVVTPGVAVTKVELVDDLTMVVGSADGTVSLLRRSSASSAIWFRPTAKFNAGGAIVSLQAGRQSLGGQVFAVNSKGEAIKYDFNTNARQTISLGSPAASLVLNATETQLAVALSDGGFTLVNPATLALVEKINTPYKVTALAYMAGAPTVLAGYETGEVVAWDLGSSPSSARLVGKDANGAVVSLNVGGSNNVAYGYANGMAFVRNAGTGAFLGQVVTDPNPVFDGSGKPVLTPQGQPVLETISEVRLNGNANELLIATRAKQIYRYPLFQTTTSNFSPGQVLDTALNNFQGASRRATALSDGSIQLAGTLNAKIQVSTEAIVDIQWNQSGTILGALDAKGNLFLLYNPGTPSYNLVPISNSAITSPFVEFAFSSDSQSLATATESGLIHEWDLAPALKTPKFQFTLPASATYPVGSPGRVVGLTYTPDGRFLATADQVGFSRVWNRDPLDIRNKDSAGKFTPSYIGTLGSISDSIPKLTSIASSPNSSFLAVGNEFGQVDVFDLTRFRLISRTKGAPTPVVNLGFSASSQEVLSATQDGWIRVTQTVSGAHIATFRDSNQKLVAFAVDLNPPLGANNFMAGYEDGVVEVQRRSTTAFVSTLNGQGEVPTIQSVTRLPANGVSTNTIPSDIVVTFNGLFDTQKFNSQNPVRFVGRGPDGIFDTNDDIQVKLAPLEAIAIGTNYATFRIVGVMTPDVYQFRIDADNATNPFGVKLDGNGDGVPGDDYLGPVFDYLGNTGTIYGRVTAGLQQFTKDQVGVEGRRVFADLNNNGVFDAVYSPGGEGPTRTVFATQVPRAIDNSAPTNAILDVTGANGRAGAITSVVPRLTLKHTFLPDIRGYLEAPNGTRIELFSRLPASAVFAGITGLRDIEFRNDPTLPTLTQFLNQNRNSGRTVLTGAVRPTGDLSAFNGLSTYGRWRMIIVDDVGIDNGYLQSWSLRFQTSEPTSVQNSLNSQGQVVYLTTTDANGYFAIPNQAAGLAAFTSTQLNILLDTTSADQRKFADFVDVFPLNGARQVSIDNRSASLKNDYQEVLATPGVTLTRNGVALLPNVALDVNSAANFDLTLTPAVFSINGTKAGSFARGSSFNTVSDKIQIFADANNDGVLTPSELVKTVNYNNGQTSTTVSQALANPSNPLADGTYTIYAVQGALDRYVSAPVRVGMINLKSIPPGAPAITSVSPLLNTIVQSTNPTFVGSSIAGVTIELFRSGASAPIGTGTTDANGNWTIPATVALPQGASSIVAFAVDFLGNRSVASAPFNVTVDTVGPAAPTITNVVGAAPNPSIPSATGVYFSSTSPTAIQVNLVQADIATVYLNGVALFKTSSPVGPGLVSLNLPTLAENSTATPYTLTVTQTNGFGIEGKPSNAVQLVVSDNAPAAPSLGSITVDSGRSSTDRITNAANLILSGSADPWTLVSVSINGNPAGTAASNGSGVWTLNLTAVTLPEGNHQVSLKGTSAIGVEGPASTAVPLVIDQTAPLLPTQVGVRAPLGALPGFTTSQSPTITGKGEINAIVTLTDPVGTVLGTGLVDANGDFAVAVTQNLGVGSKTVNIILTDVAGNNSVAFPYSFVITPVLSPGSVSIGGISQDTGYSSTDGITRALVDTVVGAGPLNTRIRLVLNAGTANELVLTPTDGSLVPVNANGQWTFNAPLGIPFTEGRHFLTATAIDQAGNSVSSEPYRVIIDFTAPRDTAIRSISSSTGNNEFGYTDQMAFTIGGKAEAFARVTLYLNDVLVSDAISVSEAGNWSFKLPEGLITSNGNHRIKIETLDAAGNVSVQPALLDVMVDTQPPAPPSIDGIRTLDGSFSLVSSLSRMVIQGQAPAGAKVEVILTPVGGTAQNLGFAIASTNGIWSLDNTLVLRPSGDYTVSARVINRAGVPSQPADVVVRIDTEAPNAPLLTGFASGVPVLGSLVGTSSPRLVGTAEPRARVEIEALSENGVLVRASGVANASGAFSILLEGLENAAMAITARVRDAAGNLSPASSPVNVVIDTQGPVASVQTPVAGGLLNPQTWLGEFAGTTADEGSGTKQVALAIQGPGGLWFNGATFSSATKVFVNAQGTSAWKLPFAASLLPNGQIQFTVRATDNLGNVSESAIQTFRYSSALPSVNAFTLVAGSGAGVFQGSVTFSTPVSGLALAGFITSNAEISNLQGSGASYTFTARASKFGRLTVSVAAGAAKDEFGNPNQSSATVARSYASATAFKISAGQGETRPIVRVIGPSGTPRDYQAFDPAFRGGVRSALLDFNKDGVADILAVPGPGGGPVLRLINGANGAVVQSIMAFSSGYTGGLFVAAGDVNGDGFEDAIVSTGGRGLGQVKVFSGKDFRTVLSNFVPYAGFAGAITVASGDTNGDNTFEIITGTGAGVRADVRVYSGTGTFVRSVQAPAGAGTAGVFVAAGDLNSDGFAEVITSTGMGVASEVRVNYLATGPGTSTPSPVTLRPFNPQFLGGARVGVADANGDGILDLIVGTGNGPSFANRYSGADFKLIDQIFLEGNVRGGVFV